MILPNSNIIEEQSGDKYNIYISLPYQMLDGTHLILCQQMEYYTVPIVPRNIHHIEKIIHV